jgi:saccharopine dehydrogenase-like NADP-dependent oxidoreductase
VIKAGKSCVDISFFPEDARGLNELAASRGVTAIVDCGVMPGFGGMLAAYFSVRVDRAERLRILVGGLPVERHWPLEYIAPFSPVDVIEEYTRPARLREGGEIVTREALSEPELVELPEAGELVAFNTDGLRSLLHTLDIPEMAEKTLRYPGHYDAMWQLKQLGFLGTEEVEVAGKRIKPVELTGKLLSEAWHFKPGTRELTVMRVEVEGELEGRRKLLRCDLYDMTDPATGDLSMARTTGLTAVFAARLLAGDRLPKQCVGPGIIFPELLGLDSQAFMFMRDGLESEGIRLTFSELAV